MRLVSSIPAKDIRKGHTLQHVYGERDVAHVETWEGFIKVGWADGGYTEYFPDETVTIILWT